MGQKRWGWLGAVGVVVALAAIYWWGIRGERQSSLDPEETAFALTDTASVTRIHLTQFQEGDSLLWIDLRRRPDGGWTVNQVHNAFAPQIQHVLTTLHRLEVLEPLTGQGLASAEKILSLMHTRVEVYDQQGLVKTYLLGTEGRGGKGSLMQLAGADRPYMVHRPDLNGFINPFFTLDLDIWREKLLFDAQPARIREIRIEYAAQPEENLTLAREPEGEWLLQPGGLAPRAGDLRAYLDRFQGKVYFESFAERRYVGLKEVLLDEQPDVTFSVTYLDGSQDRLRLWDRPAQNASIFFGLRNDGDQLLTIQHYVLDKFLARQSDLMPPVQ